VNEKVVDVKSTLSVKPNPLLFTVPASSDPELFCCKIYWAIQYSNIEWLRIPPEAEICNGGAKTSRQRSDCPRRSTVLLSSGVDDGVVVIKRAAWGIRRFCLRRLFFFSLPTRRLLVISHVLSESPAASNSSLLSAPPMLSDMSSALG
jgi:hypothetical protein